MIKRLFFISMMLFYSILFAQGISLNTEEYFDALIATKFKKVYASSFLIEKGKPRDYYAPEKAFDNDINTAWVEGVECDGIGEYILFHIPIKNSRYDRKSAKIKLNIVNGYAKNEKLFLLNNRVKEFRLEIYEASVTGMSDASGGPHIYFRSSEVILNQSKVYKLEDVRDRQTFEIVFTSKRVPTVRDVFYECVGKIEILSVYKGSQMQDTSISEISAMGTTEY